MEYEARLTVDVQAGEGPTTPLLFHATLGRPVRLPFPPAPGVSLGLLDCSDFGEEEETVSQVMYHVPSRRFFADLESHPWRSVESARDAARWLIADGWELCLEVLASWDTPAAATGHAADPNNSYDPGTRVVAVAGEAGAFILTPNEYECLVMDGRPHVVEFTLAPPSPQ